MALLRPTPWTQQPRGIVPIDRGNPFGARVIDALVGAAAKTLVQGKPVTKYGTLSAGAYPGGYGYKSAGAGGFGFPCNLTGNSELTFVFEYTQHSRSGSQVLFEHSVNQNSNAGTFVVYTDAATGRLYYGTSAGGGKYDSGYCDAPPLGVKTTIALRLRFSEGLGTVDIGVAVNGVLQATTTPVTSDTVMNFGNFQTYFFGRAGTTLNANATFGGYAVLKGFATDAELASLSANPWQIFKPIPRRIFAPVAAGGANTWNLDPTSSIHGQSTSVGSLALSYILSAQSAAHAQVSTQAEITTGKTFDPVATSHAQSSASPAITFNVTYAPSGAGHAQSVTQSAITLAYTLSPSGALHAQASTASEISSSNVFDPVSSSHAHSAASPAISLNITATPASASHAHAAGSSALNLSYVLSANGADHAQLAGQCSLTIGGAGTGATAEEIAAAVLAALSATTIPVDVQKMNSAEVIGDGSVVDPWRGVGVIP